MAECNNRPIPGNNSHHGNEIGGAGQFDHRAGDGRRNPSHWSAEEDYRSARERQPTKNRNGTRGYRTEGHPSPPPSRWDDNCRKYNDKDGRRHDGYSTSDRSRGGRAADKRIDSNDRSGMRRDGRIDDGYDFNDRSSGGRAADKTDHDQRNGNGGRNNDQDRSHRNPYSDSRFRDNHYDSNNRRYEDDIDDDRHASSRGQDYRGSGRNENDDRFRRDGYRDNRYNDIRGRERSRHRDDGRDSDRYLGRRERSVSGDYSDGYDDPRRDSCRGARRHDDRSRRDDGRRFDRGDDRRKLPSRHCSSDDGSDDLEEDTTKKRSIKEPREWPPSFQKSESSFTFDARSAMFYEPLSDFFYDPKSKLYYGNKKNAYFRYDDQKKPPFVEVHKMSAEQVEERQRGDTGGITQEKVVPDRPAPKPPSQPKIAIKFKTKKVKSSKPSLASREAASNQQPAASTVSKLKQQQIANIGKWNVKQAELKQQSGWDPISKNPALPETKGSLPKKQSIRTTAKGEPICMLCKRKFPNLLKLNLHVKASELHKKNLLKLREKKKQQQQQQQAAGGAGTKRKVDETTASAPGTNSAVEAAPIYTDRAEKRRQLHGVDVCAPAGGLRLLEQLEPNTLRGHREDLTTDVPATDLLDESNVGHKLLQKMGYKAEDRTNNDNSNGKPKTADEHLRKEWDRIEAMAQKPVRRNRY